MWRSGVLVVATCMAWCGGLRVPASAAAADTAQLSASVDRTQISLQEEAVLTVTVDGHSHAQITLPALPDFNVAERGSSRQMQFINGAMSSQVSYHYALMPKRIGSFIVGAVQAQVGAKTWHSEPFQIDVSQVSTAHQESDDVFLTADVSETRPMLGQQIIYTWRLLRRVHVANGQITLPSFEGFVHQDLGPQKEFKTLINGQQYDVVEIRKALFADQSGTLHIDGSKLNIDMAVSHNTHSGGIFGHPLTNLLGQVHSRSVVLSTPPLTVEVTALPEPIVESTHLVGHFSIEAHLGQSSLQLGDSTTLSLTVRGDGYIPSVVEPPLPDLPNIKLYSDKPATETHIEQDRLWGSRTFRKALVPTASGTLALPGVRVPYFDPTTKTYKTATSPDFVLHVAPNPHAPAAAIPPAAKGPEPVVKADVQVLHDDILPLYRGYAALTSRLGPPGQARLALLFGLPPAVYFCLWRLARRRLQAQDVLTQRRRQALRRATKRLEQMAQLLGQNEASQAAACGSRALREFLGDRLGREGLALTPQEARRLLAANGLPATLCVSVEGLLQRLEAAQYSERRTGNSGSESARQIGDVLRALHKQLPA